MNVPWVCYTCHALLYGGVGLAYRAWNSVVFLLLTGIAKPLTSVKNRRTSRFLLYTFIVLTDLKFLKDLKTQTDLNQQYQPF